MINKKILASILMIGMLAFGLGFGTQALFSDTETSSENTFTAGTLKLDVQSDNGEVVSYTFENIKPGDSAGWEGVTSPWVPGLSWTVTNIGSLGGVLTVSIVNLVDYYWDQENVALDEYGVPLSLVVAGAGDPRLSTQLRPQVRVNGAWKTETSGLHNLNPFTVDLAAGQTVTIAIAWSMPEAAGDEYQGAKTTLDVQFDLEQA